MNARKAFCLPGISVALVTVVVWLPMCYWLFIALPPHPPSLVAVGLLVVLSVFLGVGFFQVQPNQGQVLQLFGRYLGTVRNTGLRWNNPFCNKRPISLRVRNFQSSKLKVNDSRGNPIEIAAIVVWQVADTAEAVFCVDNYENFVQIQSESALRQMAQSYPYDAHGADSTDAVAVLAALRSHGEEINTHLANQIRQRLGKAGVQVIKARISHLAYAQEIAQAMLQRRQASAIITARTRIVKAAVSMVEMALSELSKRGVVELDGERRAAMVSNLLVVPCGERGTQPIVNTGALQTH